MPVTKHKPSRTSAEPDVLTLGEAAAFLRVSEEAVLGLVTSDGFPARQIGGEWRFLKSGIVEWLRHAPPPGPARGSREAVLRHFGVFRDDGDLDAQLAILRALRDEAGR